MSLLRDTHNTFCTRSVWVTESAMKAFMLAGPHRQVMRRLLEWCDEAALVHWEQETDQEPDWQQAHRRLQVEGRRSKVNPPVFCSRKLPNSAAHIAGQPKLRNTLSSVELHLALLSFSGFSGAFLTRALQTDMTVREAEKEC